MARGSSNSDLKEANFNRRAGDGSPLRGDGLGMQTSSTRSSPRQNPVSAEAIRKLDEGFGRYQPGSMMPKQMAGTPRGINKTLRPDAILGNFGVAHEGNIFRDLEVLHPALYKQMEGKGLSETISKDLMEEARREGRLQAGFEASRGKKSGEIYVASPEYKIPPTTAIDRRNGERNRYAGGNVRFTQKIEWRVAAGSDPRAENPTIEFLHGWEIQRPNGPRVQVWETEPPRFSSKSSERDVVVETRRGR